MSVIRTFAVAALSAAALSSPAFAQRDSIPSGNQPVVGRHRGWGGPGSERMGSFRDLNLTDAQKTQIKAIRAKYQGQFKTARDQARPYLDAARTARQKGDTAAARADMLKARDVMQGTAAVRQQETAEIRAVLTPDQTAKFDAQMKKRQEQRGLRGGRGGRGQRGGRGGRGGRGRGGRGRGRNGAPTSSGQG